MGVLSFLGILGREPSPVNLQRDYLFEVLLPNMKSASGVTILGTEISRLCQKASFGDYSLSDVTKLRYGPFTRSFTGFFEIPDLILEFIIPVNDFVSQYFTAWKLLMVDENGFYLPKVSYSKDAHIRLYDRTGQLSSDFKLEGIFPKTFPNFSVAYPSEDIVRYSINFNVDFISNVPLTSDSDAKPVDIFSTGAFKRSIFS